ncbi:MAG: fibronectin type III domain-containing protein, partial [Armatimonadota bacterium]
PPATSSALRREDSNLPAVAPGAHMLVRSQSQHIGRHNLAAARQLQYRKVGSNAWRPVGALAVPPYDMPLLYPSTWFADGDPITTQRLSTPIASATENFIGGQARQSELDTDPANYGPQDFAEDVWSLWIHPQAPAGLDLEFRVTRSGQPFEQYLSYPRLTVAGYAPTEMDVKANQLFANARPLAQLRMQRDDAWWDLSDRLLFPFTITRRLKAVTTADLMLDNSDGMLARDNRVSSWNYDVSSAYDPLLDEGRLVRIQQGVELHPNLAYSMPYACVSASPTRPESLRGTELSDGGFGQPRNEVDDAWVGWHGTEATVVFSLSPARQIHSVAASLLSRSAAGVLLPTSASVTLVGSAGSYMAPLPVDHLRDDPAGRRQYICGLDVHQQDVSQVILRFSPKSQEAWIHIDEIAIYDESTTMDWLKTTFTGILGDDITQHATDRGVIHLGQVRDMTKRLADLFIEVFDHYADLPIEEIVEDLLTSARYEAALSGDDYSLDSTAFIMPKWTEQNASLLDAGSQLAKMIGWVLEADDDGIYTLHDLEWTTQTGEETYLSDRDLLGWAPSVSGINLRNRIVVKSRDARNRDIRVTVQDPESIARYGPRLFTIFEPTMRSAPLARQLANSIRRDYSWIQPTGSGVIAGDVFMRPGRVVTVVHSGCTHSGPEQLYRVEAVTHRQTGHRHGQHTMTLELRGYRHRVPSAPDSLVAHPMESAVRLDWAPQPEDPSIVGYRVFQAGTVAGSYSQVASTGVPPATVTSLTNAQTYWFKVAAWNTADVLGEFAGPVPCAPQSGGLPTQAEATWQPQSLTASLVYIWGMSRPSLAWYPRLPAPTDTCYNIYRSQVSTGPYSLIATRTQPGAGLVTWIDYSTERLRGSLYYEVTFYDPGNNFESWPSPVAQVVIP